jgi:hypothetical protein
MAETSEADQDGTSMDLAATDADDMPLTMGGYAELPPDMCQFIQMFGSGKRTAGQGSQASSQPNLLRGADPQNEEERFIFLSKFHTVTCNTYRKGKMCPFDKRCLFAHGANEMRRNPLIAACPYGPDLCPMVRDGKNCEHGMMCPFSRNLTESLYHPERYKTKVCQKWLAGYCHREGACAFIHDPRYFGVNSNGNGRTSRRQNGKSLANGASASGPGLSFKGMNPAFGDQSTHQASNRNTAQASRGNHQPVVPEVTMIFSSARPHIMDFLRQHAHSALVPLPGGMSTLLQDTASPEKEYCFQEMNRAIALAIGNQGGSILLGFHPHHIHDAYIRQQASLNHRQFMILSKVMSSALQMYFASAGIKSCKVIIHELTDSASSHGPIVISEIVIETFSPRFNKQHLLQVPPKMSAGAHYQAQPSSSFSSTSNPFSDMLFAPTSAASFHGTTSENTNFVSSSSQVFMTSSFPVLGSKESDAGRLHEKVRGILPIEQAMVWSNLGHAGFPQEPRFSMESTGLDEPLQQMHLGLFLRTTSQNPTGIGSVHDHLDSTLYSADDVSMWNAFPDASHVMPSDPKTLGSSW